MWEALLQTADLGADKEDIRFKPSRTANPYREVVFSDVNRGIISGTSVEVNAHYRYGAVFGALLGEDMDDCSELRETLFDIVAHCLTELDLRQGLCSAEYYARFLREDIVSGLFGRQNAQRLSCFTKAQLRLVLSGLLRMYRLGMSMRMFAQMSRELYPGSIVYLDVCGERVLLFYVGRKETPALRGQLELLCDLFVPADCEVKLFWDMHFGLIGTDETMEIGNIMMF
jgi:hypothetical protein